MGSVVFFEKNSVEGEPDVRWQTLLPHGPGVPNVQFVEYEPGHHEKAHRHEEGEVFYVLDGELTIGGHRLRAGDGAFIPANTEYGPVIGGSEGAHFLRVGLGR